MVQSDRAVLKALKFGLFYIRFFDELRHIQWDYSASLMSHSSSSGATILNVITAKYVTKKLSDNTLKMRNSLVFFQQSESF